MLVNDNEFGAPWNDQFYEVQLVNVDTGIPSIEIMVLSGPREYST